jgi:hypothetical protein
MHSNFQYTSYSKIHNWDAGGGEGPFPSDCSMDHGSPAHPQASCDSSSVQSETGTSTEGDDKSESASDVDCSDCDSDCDSDEYSHDGLEGDDGYSAANGTAGAKRDVEFFKRRLHEPYRPGELPYMCKCMFLICHLILPTKFSCLQLHILTTNPDANCHRYYSNRGIPLVLAFLLEDS